MKQTKKLKIELAVAIVSLMICAVSLSTVTYAWYVSNNVVIGSTTRISATTNGFILQIATAEQGVSHGGSQESLAAETIGGQISPSSTDNLKDWYVFAGWNSHGDVTSYAKITFADGEDTLPGQYGVDGSYFAYVRGDYVLYTIVDTGFADVYLLDDGETPAIEVTRTSGEVTNQTLPQSLRVGIASYDLETEEETLRLVYAPANETGIGNDVNGIEGWTCVYNSMLQDVTYDYVYDMHYVDNNGKNRAAVKDGDNFSAAGEALPVIPDVGYEGVGLRIYIWLEGTDEQCVNNAEEDDVSVFDVTVKLAGVAK